MARKPIRETELYDPVKRLLEGQGYEVKSEVGAADVVASRDGEDPVIVELKVSFSLALFHQAIARQSLTDAVYVAVPHVPGPAFAKSVKNNIALCRRLGLGLMTVRIKKGTVAVLLDPAPYQPRKSKPRRTRLLMEFAKRVGDPNTGGATRARLMTSYRQEALRCLSHLNASGPTKAALVAQSTGVEKARRLMADDHYGWFERVSPGIYAITPKGIAALETYADDIAALKTDAATTNEPKPK